MFHVLKMMERKVSGNSISSLIGERLPVCSGCGELIKEQYLLEAVEKFWHENCLKCSLCKGSLAEMATTFYAKADLLLCKRDYFRLFGRTGNCSACHKDIPSFEYVMRARGNSYHLDCFACQSCNQRFCVGDRFYLYEDRILCEEDYKDVISSRHHGLDHHNHHSHHPHHQHHHHLNNNPVIPSNNCVNNNSNNNNNNSSNNNNTPSGGGNNSNKSKSVVDPPGSGVGGVGGVGSGGVGPNQQAPPPLNQPQSHQQPQQARLYSCHDH